MTPATTQQVRRQRTRLLAQYAHVSEPVLTVLGIVWLVLLIVELTGRLDPVLERIGLVIWIVFVVDFAIRFAIAPAKGRFVRGQWLTLLSLALPAMRLFRAVRLLRAARAIPGGAGGSWWRRGCGGRGRADTAAPRPTGRT